MHFLLVITFPLLNETEPNAFKLASNRPANQPALYNAISINSIYCSFHKNLPPPIHRHSTLLSSAHGMEMKTKQTNNQNDKQKQKLTTIHTLSHIRTTYLAEL